MANEMARHGFSVICLEQGRWFNNAEFPGQKDEWELLAHQRWNHDPNIRGFAEDYPLATHDSDLNPVMIAGVGGSSIFYGGHWMRLLPSDFRMHTLDGVGDDGPLTYDDLSPYYDKIDNAVAKASFDITHWPAAIRHGAQLRTHCRLRQITTGKSGRADGAVYFDADGVEHEQKARLVVLAANGIGTPRLLLLSANSSAPNGLVNSSGLVVKRLMLHPNGEITGTYDEPMQSWPGPAGQSIHSLEFYEIDSSRGFVGGAKRQVMPTGGPLRPLSLYDRAPLEEQWGRAIHDRMRETLDSSLQLAINSQDMPRNRTQSRSTRPFPIRMGSQHRAIWPPTNCPMRYSRAR